MLLPFRQCRGLDSKIALISLCGHSPILHHQSIRKDEVAEPPQPNAIYNIACVTQSMQIAVSKHRPSIDEYTSGNAGQVSMDT